MRVRLPTGRHYCRVGAPGRRAIIERSQFTSRRTRHMRTFARLVTVFLLAIASASAPLSAGLIPAVGPSFSSIGPLTFAPDGTLFAADRAAASIVALKLGAQASGKVAGTKDVESVDTKIAALLGT